MLMVVIASALGWGIGRFRIGADVSIVVLAAMLLARPRELMVRSARRARVLHQYRG